MPGTAAEVVTAPDDAILIVDGAFLLRPELSSSWDLVIWLHIPFEDMVARAIERDTVWGGDAEEGGDDGTEEHWVPLHELYERSEPRGPPCRPCYRQLKARAPQGPA